MSTRADCCPDQDCGDGLRNSYFEGKRLTPDSFRVEQRYLIGRRRLINRALHGWGVAYGFGVTATGGKLGAQQGSSSKVKIKPGLALDPCGRELVLLEDFSAGLDTLIVLDEKGVETSLTDEQAVDDYARRKTTGKVEPTCWLLSAHYAERPVDEVTVADPCRCDRNEWDRICETVRFSLRRISCRDCCCSDDCDLECRCGSGRCCDLGDPGHDKHEPEDKDGDDDARRDVSLTRGGCRCLCAHVTGRRPGADCTGELCEIKEPCGTVSVDVANGVPIACVELDCDHCGHWVVSEVDECGPRRIVKNTDLLFDLIRGCDLTYISRFGWEPWHRLQTPVSFKDFSEALGGASTGQAKYVTRKFWVEFSRPVRASTLLPDCIAITAMSVEREGGWFQTFRVPIVGVDTSASVPKPGDPPGHVRRATVVVDGAWLEDGVRGRRSLFLSGDVFIEIEVRGDLIVDCNGQTVDGNTIGTRRSRTGNGSPGGTFLSTFRVAAERDVPARPATPEASSYKGASS